MDPFVYLLLAHSCRRAVDSPQLVCGALDRNQLRMQLQLIVRLLELHGLIVRYCRIGIAVEKNKDGLVITDVDPDGRAADAGLQAGDVIQEVNRKPVTSVDDLRAAVRARSDRPVLLLVEREGHTRYVTVRPANG